MHILAAENYSSSDPWIVKTEKHAVRYHPGSKLLLVTFDHLEQKNDPNVEPKPWAFKFAVDQGWSILGVTSMDHVWFREAALFEFFTNLRDIGFFEGFDRVVFAGGSKGGYGALAFSSCSPGATVIAINPQSTLDIDLVPWEKRYPVKKWDGPFLDGAKEARTASKVVLFYDHYCTPDRRHAKRILNRNPNVAAYRCDHFGHGIATCFQKMGVLKDVMIGFVSGKITDQRFWSLMRARRSVPSVSKALVNRSLTKKRFNRAELVCDYELQKRDDFFFLSRKALVRMHFGDLDGARKALRACDILHRRAVRKARP